MPWPSATSDTRIIIHYAKQCLEKIYRPQFHYQKTGIMLLNLTQSKQMTLWQQENIAAESIMTVMDSINQKFGQGSLFTAASGFEQPWQMCRGNVSNRYTTHFKELMVVK